MSIDPELNPSNLMRTLVDVAKTPENIDSQKPLGASPAVPRFSEMLNNLLDRLVAPPQEIRVDREAHALLEYRISQATIALQAGDWRASRDHHNRARNIFGSTKLPRIAHLITRPGSLEMILRPKYDGRVEIVTDYTRDEVIYRITF